MLYSLYEQDRVHNVYFFAPRGYAEPLVAESERAMATLRMNRATLTRFGAPRWLRKTLQVAKAAAPALGLGAAVGAMMLARRRSATGSRRRGDSAEGDA